MAPRIFLDIVILSSILYFPWWVTALLVIVGIFSFKYFYEAIIAGFLIDLLYGTKTEEFWDIWFVFSLLFSILYFLSEWFKRSIR